MKKILDKDVAMYNVYLMYTNSDGIIKPSYATLLVTDGDEGMEEPVLIVSVDLMHSTGIYNYQTLSGFVFNNQRFITRALEKAIEYLGGTLNDN